MAKNSITDYSKTASLNTDIQSVDIDEGCLPSGINNAIRELMADLADVNDGTVALTSPSFAAASLTGNLSFGDNNKAIFGASSDLQIYHDGTHSYVRDEGTGGLILTTNGAAVYIQKGDTETSAEFDIDGAVKLRYDNAQKFATTSTGIDVNGTVTANGLTVDTNTLHVDSTNNRVGIGTTSPSQVLEITNGTSPAYVVQTRGDLQTILGPTGSLVTSAGQVGTITNSPFRFTTNNTERMRIDTSGRLLVGTTTNNGANAGTIIAGDTVATAGAVALQVTYTTDDSLVNYGSQYSSGDALIGHGVASSQTAADTFISTADNAAFARGALLVGDLLRFYNASAQTTTKGSAVSMTERMRIDASGYMHIGTGGSQAGATVSGTSIRSLDILKSTNTTSGFNQIVFYNPNGAVGTIRTTGSSTAYNTSSDYRLKENVTGITDGIERVKQLNPSRFNFIIDADTTVDGFLAHEAATVVPEAVSGEKDAVDEDGNPEYQGIDQAKLVPLLTAALQEAITKIEDLEARVATLEGN